MPVVSLHQKSKSSKVMAKTQNVQNEQVTQEELYNDFLGQAEKMLEGKSSAEVLAGQMLQQHNLVMQINELRERINKPKDLLTLKEAADFLGFSQSYTYKMVHEGMLPCFKPFGKVIYFERAELEAVLRTNRMATVDEITAKAEGYIMNNPI